MKYTQAYSEQTRLRDSQWGSCLIKSCLSSRGVSSLVMCQRGTGQRKGRQGTDGKLTHSTGASTNWPSLSSPPTARSCPSWFFSALSCPCCTTSAWCSGSLERYWGRRGSGDSCRAALFPGPSLTCLLPRFFQVLSSLYQDPPLPPQLLKCPKSHMLL